MKKKLILIIIAVMLLAAAGGAAYYFFFYEETPLASEALPLTESEQGTDLTHSSPEAEPSVTLEKRYIISLQAEVYSAPRFDSDLVDVLDLRDEVKVYESQGRWIRINNATDNKQQWVYQEETSSEFPSVTKRERYRAIKRLIHQTDDLEANEARFVELTDGLLNSGECSEEDLRILNGWIRSHNYRDEAVYYTYCGGTDSQNKVYLNLTTGKWFQAPPTSS